VDLNKFLQGVSILQYMQSSVLAIVGMSVYLPASHRVQTTQTKTCYKPSGNRCNIDQMIQS